MSKVTQRAVGLTSHDVVAVLALAKTAKALPVEKSQSFLTSIWMDWRNSDEGCKDVMEGVGAFFDFYFMFHGDFDAIYKTMLQSIDKKHHHIAITRSDNLVAQNISAANSVKGPMSECQVVSFGEVPLTVAPSTQEAN